MKHAIGLFVVLSITMSFAADNQHLSQLPRDVQVVYGWRDNPERAFLKPYMDNLWEKAREAELGRHLMTLLKDAAGDKAGFGIQLGVTAVTQMLSAVDWTNLGAQGAFAVSLEGPYAVCVLTPNDPDRAFQDIQRLCKQVLMLAPDQLAFSETPEGQCGLTDKSSNAFGIRCLKTETGLRLVISAKAQFPGLKQPAGGKARGAGFPANPVWRQAASQLPMAEDSLYFVDAAGIMKRVRHELNNGLAGGLDGADQKQALQMMLHVAGELGLFQSIACMAGTAWTDGRLLRSAGITVMAPGWSELPLGRMLKAMPPAPVPFDQVPGGATSVTFQSAVGSHGFFKALKAAIEAKVGADVLNNALAPLNATLGFDIMDLVHLLEGHQVSYMVRSTKPQLFGAADQSISMVTLKSPAAAKAVLAKLNAWLTNAATQQFKGMLAIKQDGDFPEFMALQPMGMPMGAMGWGIRNDVFYFATDLSVLKQSLRGENRGDTPFLWRDDVSRLGLFPQGPVHSYSYLDLGRTINNAAQTLNMMGIAAAFIPEDMPEKDIVKKVIAFFPRLSVLLRHMDFFGGMATTTTFDRHQGVFYTNEVLEVPDRTAAAKPGQKPETPEKKPAVQRF